jgi:YbgC/YbaW family acyl-CoA thioester hydrolase
VSQPFSLRRRVAFSETDLAGIVHFSNILRYAEDAEHAFFRSLGHSVKPRPGDGRSLGYPRLKAAFRFFSPLHFEEEFEVRVLVREVRERSLTYGFEIHALGDAEPRLCARGTMTAVCVEGVGTGKVVAVPIPSGLRAKLEVAPEEAFLGWDEG